LYIFVKILEFYAVAQSLEHNVERTGLNHKPKENNVFVLKNQKVQVNCWKHQIQVLVQPENKKMLNYTLNNNVDAIWWKCLLSFTQSVQIFTMLFPSHILKS
jgi:hypothetical protein